MSKRREKLNKGWKRIKRKVESFVHSVEPGPSIMVLYMKEGRESAVQFAGSTNLLTFAKSIEGQFRAAACGEVDTPAENTPTDTSALAVLDPTSVKMANLRTIIATLVQSYVNSLNYHGRGYYDQEQYRPPWWISDIPFQSPNNRKGKKDHLKLHDLQRLLASYQVYQNPPKEQEVSLEEDQEMESEEEQEVAPTERMENTCADDTPANEGIDERIDEKYTPNESEVPSKSSKKCRKEQVPMTTKRKINEVPSTSSKLKSTEAKKNEDVLIPLPEIKLISDQVIDSSNVTPLLLRSLANLSTTDLHSVAEKLLSAIKLPPTASLSAKTDLRFQVPANYQAYRSLEQGDCFFSSLSLLLFGSNNHKDLLRLGTGLFGVVHTGSYIEKFIAEGNDNIASTKMLLQSVARDEIIRSLDNINDFRILLQQTLKAEGQLTFRPTSYVGFLQILFASGFLQRPIKQFCEGIDDSDANIYTGTVYPYPQCTAFQGATLNIMWVALQQGGMQNHVVPLEPVGRVSRKLSKPESWSWIKASAKACTARLFGWCSITEDEAMFQCAQCKSWAHPECFGIHRNIFLGTGLPWHCCPVLDGPDIEIVNINGHKLHMQDFIAIQPGNWFTNWLVDFGIGMYFTENESCFCFPSTLWETLRKNNTLQIRKYKELYANHFRKRILIFPVVEGGHWMIVLVYESDTLLVIDSIRNTTHDAYKSHQEKINRFLGTNMENVHVVKVPQQQNGYDCGPYTVCTLKQLSMKVPSTTSLEEIIKALETLEDDDAKNFRKNLKHDILQTMC